MSWLKNLKDSQDMDISVSIASSSDIMKTLLSLAQAGSTGIPKSLNTALNCLHRISAQAPIPQPLFEDYIVETLKISANSSEDSQLKALQCILPIVTQQLNLSLNNLVEVNNFPYFFLIFIYFLDIFHLLYST